MGKTGLTRKTKAGRAALAEIANAAKALKVLSPEEKAARSAAHSARLRVRHANTPPEKKAATAEKRRQSLIAYWAERKGNPDPERSRKISEAQKRAYASLTPRQKAARRALLVKANRIANSKPHRKLSADEMATANEKRAQSWTEEARLTQAARSSLAAASRSPEEKEAIQNRRIAAYFGRSAYDRQKTADKLRQVHLNRTDDEKRAILARQQATKRTRGTFNTSQDEEKAYALLCSYFDPARIHRNFRSPVYPYACDFVIRLTERKSHVKDALFIECNFHWTHGKEPFDSASAAHAKTLRRWKARAKSSQYFSAGVSVWTKRDVEKRELARKNKLSWFEFFSLPALAEFLERAHRGPKLAASYTDEALSKALDRIASKAPKYINEFTFNFMAHFYQKETALWRDKVTRFRLLANREKYLGKPAVDLTDQEILAGFRKAGLTHREHFSHFPVCLVRQFVDLVKPKSVYDPFLGWGHRMVGFAALNVAYTGNDLWVKSYRGGAKIAEWLRANRPGTQCEVLLGDAAAVKPTTRHDAVFTCPPYPLKAEVYGSDAGAEHLALDEYWRWWSKVVATSCLRSTRSVGLVVPAAYEQEFSGPVHRKGFVLVHRQLVLPSGRAASHLNVKKNFEVFLVWKRS